MCASIHRRWSAEDPLLGKVHCQSGKFSLGPRAGSRHRTGVLARTGFFGAVWTQYPIWTYSPVMETTADGADPRVRAWAPVCQAIALLLGPYAEVVLHDVASDRVLGVWNPMS